MSVSLTAMLAPAHVSVGASRLADGWAIDVHAVERACETLGLQRRVVIDVTNGRRYAGLYKGVHQGAHRISLAGWQAPTSASRTLWHELTHAMQRERGTLTHNPARSRSSAVYRAHPNEVEAERNEAMHEQLALVRY